MLDRLINQFLESTFYKWFVLHNLTIVAVWLAAFVCEYIPRDEFSGYGLIAALSVNSLAGLWKVVIARP